MNQREIWLHVYTVCRQQGDDHTTAFNNAEAVVGKTEGLSSVRPA